jgi:methyl-accepting chemotaxis protein
MATNNNAEVTRIRQEVDRVAVGTDELIRISDQVLSGTKIQIRSLTDAVGAANETSSSLKETAAQAETVAGAAERLASASSEMSASI